MDRAYVRPTYQSELQIGHSDLRHIGILADKSGRPERPDKINFLTSPSKTYRHNILINVSNVPLSFQCVE